MQKHCVWISSRAVRGWRSEIRGWRPNMSRALWIVQGLLALLFLLSVLSPARKKTAGSSMMS